MKPIIFISALLLLASCYNYEGPIREAHKTTTPVYSQPKVYTPQPEKVTSQAYLQKMAAAIKKRLPEAEVKLLEDSILVLFPNNIVYDKNKISPKEDIYQPIGKLAQLINKFDQTDVLVTGHSDNVGDKNQNKNISKLRAQYIHDLLVAYKVSESRLEYWGLGDIAPIADNDTEKGRAKNRRVEFIILSTIQD